VITKGDRDEIHSEEEVCSKTNHRIWWSL